MEKEKKSHKSLIIILIFLMLVGAVVFYLIWTDPGFMTIERYSTVPTGVDMSDSEYVGDWEMCGEGHYLTVVNTETTEYDPNLVWDVEFYTVDEIEKIKDNGDGELYDDEGVGIFMPETRHFYSNGRGMKEVLNLRLKSEWKETDDGISWDYLDPSWETEKLYLINGEIQGHTPQECGLSGDKFLVYIEPPYEEVEQKMQPGEDYLRAFMVFAKK